LEPIDEELTDEQEKVLQEYYADEHQLDTDHEELIAELHEKVSNQRMNLKRKDKAGHATLNRERDVAFAGIVGTNIVRDDVLNQERCAFDPEDNTQFEGEDDVPDVLDGLEGSCDCGAEFEKKWHPQCSDCFRNRDSLDSDDCMI
jgi:hypothetical protein